MKVISFGLWGNHPRYTHGAESNVILARRFYPGWNCWFFCDQTVPQETIDILSKQPDCRVLVFDSTKEQQHRLFWRFWVAGYPEVETFIIRDTDSRIGQREQLAVLEWLSQGTAFHIMRDNPAHGVPMCGGMWGCHAQNLRNIKSMIDQYYRDGKHNKVVCGVDQDFLHAIIWPMAMNNCTQHDEFFVKRPFPNTIRDEKYYVGRVFAPDQGEKIWYSHTPLLPRG